MVALLTACSGGAAEPLVAVAGPAVAPQATGTPAGVVLPSPGIRALVADPTSGTLVAATGSAVSLRSLEDPAAPPRGLPLGGPAAALTVNGDTLLAAVPDRAALAEIGLPDGTPRERTEVGAPVKDVVVVGGRTVLALGSSVQIRDADGRTRTVDGFADAAALVPVGDRVVVLDRGRTAVSLLNPADGSAGPALRTGEGATNAAGDRFGRVLLLDTREGELLVVAGDPLLLRQRYPVPGAPYGLAYDPERDLAWVTLTARNEVVGFDVAGGEPEERHRFDTVDQPNSVAVDPATGRVFVGSASGAGLQVIDPGGR